MNLTPAAMAPSQSSPLASLSLQTPLFPLPPPLSSPRLPPHSLSSSPQIPPPRPRSGHFPSSLRTKITTDLPALHRRSLYAFGSAFFIMPRILIVDLLTSKVLCSNVCRIIILNAHSLIETSTEVFIIKIVNGLNRNVCEGFFELASIRWLLGLLKQRGS